METGSRTVVRRSKNGSRNSPLIDFDTASRALLLLGSLTILSGCGQGQKPVQATIRQTVSVAADTVAYQSESMRSFTTYGKVEPPRRLQFNAPARLPVKMVRNLGDRVKKGETLLTFSVDELNRKRSMLKNSLAQSTQQNERNLLTAQLQDLERQLSSSTVVAPFDVIVLAQNTSTGATVDAGQVVLQVVEDGPARISVQVSNWVKEQTAKESVFWIYLDDEQALCTVEYDLNWGKEFSSKQLFLTQRLPELKQEERQPMQSVRVRFDFPQTVNGFWVPTTALKSTGSGTWSVFGIDDVESETGPIPVAQRRQVKVLGFEGARAFVDGNFESGDRFVSRGIQKIVSGQAVQIRLASEQAGDSIQGSNGE